MRAIGRVRRDPTDDIVVRFVRTGPFEDADLASRAERLLGEDERASLARLRPAAARRDYLAAHALARTMLAEVAGSDPDRLAFGRSPRGRPELVRPRGASRLRFSISHADGLAVCAVAVGRAVGTDVESLRNLGRDPLRLAEVVCSPEEMVALLEVPAYARIERLLSCWTVKEAVVKAMGEGFYLPLSRLAVHEEDGAPSTVALDGQPLVDVLPCRFAVRRLTDRHVAAVALLGAPRDDMVLRFEEGDAHVPSRRPAMWRRLYHHDHTSSRT